MDRLAYGLSQPDRLSLFRIILFLVQLIMFKIVF